MFLRVSRQRLKSGKVIEHYQLAESVWQRQIKKARTSIVYNFGRVDDPAVVARLRKLAGNILRRCSLDDIVAEMPDWKVVDAWPYGPLHVVQELWRRVGLDKIITKLTRGRRFGFNVELAVFAMVANRALAPCSKLYCFEQWLREDIRIVGTEKLDLQHLYRAMDFLESEKEAIEKAVYFNLADLMHLDVDLIFYDTTSLHFEIDENDEGVGEDDLVHGSKLAGAKKYKAPRKRGHAKNGRSDVPQIIVGLAVTRDGLPVRHWVFPGNTVDVTTVKQVKEDLRGWRLGRCVFVGDAGMVSDENLQHLRRGGGSYIVCMPLKRGSEVAKMVTTRAGRYKRVADNLQVKEVVIGKGARQRRYVVCFNPLEVVRQRRHREHVLRELDAELIALKDLDSRSYSKRVFDLVASRRYGRYVRRTKTGKLRLDRSAVKAAEKLDGKFVVHSNDDTLSAEDMALGYKQLMRVEQAWRQLKSVLKMRPVYHWAPHRIHAHVFLTVLGLLLQRIAEEACGDTWRNITDDLKQVKLAQLNGPDGTLWQVTEPRPEARIRLKSLEITNLPTLVDHA
jgi:hypothetical protein